MEHNSDSKTNERQHLLGDLESIKQLLREDEANTATSSEKIPILLDAVPVIPVLQEVVDTPPPQHAIATQPSSAIADGATQPVTNATEKQLNLEGEQLIDNLLEEYLPMIETRLREQLRMRLNFIIKEQMRKYR